MGIFRRKPEQRDAGYRIFYASDVHGCERAWRKFIAAGRVYGVDALVMGGDLTGKAIIPIVFGDGDPRADFQGRERRFADETAVEEFEEAVSINGFYTYRCDEQELRRLQDDPGRVEDVFRHLIEESLRSWVALADERLEGSGIECWVMPGNDDEPFVDPILEGEIVHNCDRRAMPLGPYTLYSLAWSTPTPWETPRELSEEKLWEEIERVVGDADGFERAIFNFHVPPYASSLDWGPSLGEDFVVESEGGEPKRVPIGSHSVRRGIEEMQPLLGLHGHVHESRGVTSIGRTVCINPGSRYAEGVVDGAIVSLEDGVVRSQQLVTG